MGIIQTNFTPYTLLLLRTSHWHIGFIDKIANGSNKPNCSQENCWESQKSQEKCQERQEKCQVSQEKCQESQEQCQESQEKCQERQVCQENVSII